MIFQPPFPEPIEPLEAEIPVIFIHIFILVLFIILILYSYKGLKDYLMMIIVYSFSLIIGLEYMIHGHPPFSPIIEVFFLVFQTGIFLIASLDFYTSKKEKR